MNAKTAGWVRRLWEKIFPRTDDFHAMILDQCRCLERTLAALAGFLKDAREEQAAEVRRCVKEGHELSQRNLDRLHRAFVTPIDREDIDILVTRVDHVFDYAKTAVRELELLEVRADPWMSEMVDHLLRGAGALSEGIAVFRTHPNTAEPPALHMRRAERHVEKLYRQALADMFGGEAYRLLTEGESKPSCRECLDFLVTQMKRREVYRHLSNAADRLAHVGEALHDISVKYG